MYFDLLTKQEKLSGSSMLITRNFFKFLSTERGKSSYEYS
ncbi:hypothetical protein HBNCFIEN_01849 [Legionella sp. PC997]|nr:hypothetical protein HBNCFIEN_01849 [Legionella sp. PC997]